MVYKIKMDRAQQKQRLAKEITQMLVRIEQLASLQFIREDLEGQLKQLRRKPRKPIKNDTIHEDEIDIFRPSGWTAVVYTRDEILKLLRPASPPGPLSGVKTEELKGRFGSFFNVDQHIMDYVDEHGKYFKATVPH